MKKKVVIRKGGDKISSGMQVDFWSAMFKPDKFKLENVLSKTVEIVKGKKCKQKFM